jgi:hypothetical protein
MNFERRIRKLEARMIAEPVILQFADGSTRELHGPSDFLVRLLRGVCGRADLGIGQREQLELIRQSMYAHEPAGGRLTEFLRCLLHAQADAQGGVGPVGS